MRATLDLEARAPATSPAAMRVDGRRMRRRGLQVPARLDRHPGCGRAGKEELARGTATPAAGVAEPRWEPRSEHPRTPGAPSWRARPQRTRCRPAPAARNALPEEPAPAVGFGLSSRPTASRHHQPRLGLSEAALSGVLRRGRIRSYAALRRYRCAFPLASEVARDTLLSAIGFCLRRQTAGIPLEANQS